MNVTNANQRAKQRATFWEKSELEKMTEPKWLLDSVSSYRESVLDKRFPCYFGTTAEKVGDVKYFAVERVTDLELLPDVLHSFNAFSRSNPTRKASLTIFFKPEEQPMPVEFYEQKVWDVLHFLHQRDDHDWPASIPRDTQHADWQFCFDNDPLFVFAAYPAFANRLSRNYGASLVMLFQPIRIFAGIGSKDEEGMRARTLIRERQREWDPQLELHPDAPVLGYDRKFYWKSYVLPDNDAAVTSCPFKMRPAHDRTILSVTAGAPLSLDVAIRAHLPANGSLEVRRDRPGFEHRLHTHQEHETLVIVEGSIHFRVGDAQYSCTSGHVIRLPARTEHSSVAGSEGCVYVVASHGA